jgi:hypothetical protein
VFDGYYTEANGAGTQYYTAAMESAQDWDIPTDTQLFASWLYSVGDTGPAGGVVFYDKGSYSDGWRYMEAWASDEGDSIRWDRHNSPPESTPGTSRAIGSGYENTYTAMSGDDYRAALSARNATHGGYTDWFLPSADELVEMYNHRGNIGGFAEDFYWSSSESNPCCALEVNFTDAGGSPSGLGKDAQISVRVARRFS